MILSLYFHPFFFRTTEKGWGLFLGEPSEQAREIAGNLEYIQIKVRFFAPVIAFIEEGEKRYISQVIERSGKPDHIDYNISLPERSLNEFCRWLHQFVHNAQVLEPKDLRDRFRSTALKLASLYDTSQ